MAEHATTRWRKKYPEAAKELNRKTSREWRQRHPDKAHANRISPKGRWYALKSKAKKRGIPLLLTFEQWQVLAINAFCHYCNDFIQTKGCSLDRKDSGRGYELDNVVPCCISCNRIRNEDLISYEEMLYLMPLLQAYRRKRSA